MVIPLQPSPSTAPPSTGPAPMPTVVVNVPTPTVVVHDSAPSALDTAAAWAGVAALVVSVLALGLTSWWNARTDRKTADRFTAASDLDALRQLNAMGIQANAPLAPVARGLIDSLPEEDLPVWRHIIEINLVDHVPASHERMMAWLREREAPRSEHEAQWLVLAMVEDMRAAMARRRTILDDRNPGR